MLVNHRVAPSSTVYVTARVPIYTRVQGRIQKIQKEGAKETDDAVLHHSGSICDQTLGLTIRTCDVPSPGIQVSGNTSHNMLL